MSTELQKQNLPTDLLQSLQAIQDISSRDLCLLLRRFGVKRVDILYEGGNDEGAIEDPEFYADEEGEVLLGQLCYREAPQVYTILVDPVEEMYGGFNGDYTTEGTLTWYPDQCLAVLEGCETVCRSEWVGHEFRF